MALTLSQIRDYVRLHLDLDDQDLPDGLIDIWVREGSKRVEKAAPRWPFYETIWTFSTVAAQRDYPFTSISSQIDQIAGVSAQDRMLQWVGPDLYQVLNPLNSTTTSAPKAYSWWNDTLSLFPTPDTTYSLSVHGYRQPDDWVSLGAGGTPDLPDELHNTVALWAVAKAYAQQEDPELGQIYQQQFADELTEFKRRIAETPHPQPLILGDEPSRRRKLFPLRFDWQA